MAISDLPPLAALRAYEAAARTGGLSAAARELNVTHAAIAQHIKRLEEWFDTPLMRRAGRGMQVTPEGKEFADELSRGFTVLREASRRLAAQHDAEPLRITTTPAFASSWLLPKLDAYYRLGTNTAVVINPTTDVVDLENLGYDIAFRFGRGDWPDMAAELVVPSDVVLVGSRAFLSQYAVNAPEDLANVPWVEEFGTNEVAEWLGRLGVIGRLPHQVLTLPAEYTLSAIRQGQGLGIAVAVWIEDELGSGELIPLFEPLSAENQGYHMIYRKGHRRPAVERFTNWFRAEAMAQ